MVTYRVDISAHGFLDQWVVIAVYGNHLQWEVGRYRDKRQAQERIRRMEEVSKAASLTE
jgi:hypothetical protein